MKLAKNRGITLIALIITIIVLLILAAVSVAMLTGENGILTQANKAKIQSEIAEAKERAKMDIIAWQAEQIEKNENADLNNTRIKEILEDKEDYVEAVDVDSFISKKGKHEILYSELYDTSLNEPVIPELPEELPKEEGVTDPYYPSNNFEQVEGTDLSNGLVIEEKTSNNRYTWVEVPKSIYTDSKYNGGTPPTSSTDYAKIESTMQNYAKDYRIDGFTDTWYSEEQHGFPNIEKYTTHKNKMLKSVYENGGFWISQYEIGYEKDSIRTAPTDDTGLQEPVSKEGAYPYNWITCKQAQKLATKMAEGKEYKSSLMFGIQWDLVLKHMESKGKKTQTELKIDSTNWGNYINSNFNLTRGKYSEDYGKTFIRVKESYLKSNNKSILMTTGVTERNSSFNIYDIAGNVYEWTLEYTGNSSNPCNSRGGSYGSNGDGYPVFYRSSSNYNAGIHIGFRTALYK